MGKLIEVKEYEVNADTSIEEAALEACRIATHDKCIVKFSFNGVLVKVYPFLDADYVVKQYFHDIQEKIKSGFDKLDDLTKVFLKNVLNSLAK